MRKSSLVTGQQLTGANKQEALQQLAHAAATTVTSLKRSKKQREFR